MVENIEGLPIPAAELGIIRRIVYRVPETSFLHDEDSVRRSLLRFLYTQR